MANLPSSSGSKPKSKATAPALNSKAVTGASSQSPLTIGIVAPSSPAVKQGMINRAIKQLSKLGVRVVLGKHLYDRAGYLAGTDRDRAQDLNQMWGNPEVDVILALRGGYGAGRILPYLNLSPPSPKGPMALVGFSDITALHCAYRSSRKEALYHGPMLLSLFPDRGEPNEYAIDSLLSAVSHRRHSICEGYELRRQNVETIRKGKVRAEAVGGNLSVLNSLIGTPYFPDLSGKILILEDVGEAPYRLDRDLTQLILSGSLKRVAGIACGLFTDAERQVIKYSGAMDVRDVLIDRLAPLKVPFVVGLPISHTRWNATIPLGREIEFNASAGDIII